MKILAHTKSGDSIGLLDRFLNEGHQVRLFVDDPSLKTLGEGRFDKVSSMAEGVLWKPDFVFFDMVGSGKIADGIRRQGLPVFGASEWLDDIELHREKGLELCQKVGIKTPKTVTFKKMDEAIAYAKSNPEFLVTKINGNISAESSFVADDSRGLVERLEFLKDSSDLSGATFILQEKLKGIEVSSEVWFSKGKPIRPFNFTVELKKFYPGDQGPASGCMFSAVAPYLSPMPKMIEKTLKKIFPIVEKMGLSTCIDINAMVLETTHEPIWMEFTARLGFSACYALAATIDGDLGKFFYEVATGKATRVPMNHSWGVALRTVISPYPLEPIDEKISHAIYESIKGQAVKSPKDKYIYLCEEVMKDKKGRYVTAGVDGLVAECCGTSENLYDAWRQTQKRFENIKVPGKMGRVSDGVDRAYKDTMKLKSWGFEVPSPTPSSVKKGALLGA
jgi:phosphoribosylamine-glycine ligase